MRLRFAVSIGRQSSHVQAYPFVVASHTDKLVPPPSDPIQSTFKRSHLLETWEKTLKNRTAAPLLISVEKVCRACTMLSLSHEFFLKFSSIPQIISLTFLFPAKITPKFSPYTHPTISFSTIIYHPTLIFFPTTKLQQLLLRAGKGVDALTLDLTDICSVPFYCSTKRTL